MNKYTLSDLPYKYDALEPYISEEVMKLHHDKHHASYVKGANDILEKMENARKDDTELDFKSLLKSLSFNIAGHLLHEIFWKTMASADSGKNKPEGKVLSAIEKEFSSVDRFKKEFSEAGKSVEGSGWALLAYDKSNKNLNILQIEKHNVNFYPEQTVLLPLDVWEHSYYLDYKNDKAKFIENWWNIVNWQEVEERFSN